MALANNIVKYRKRNKLSQEELAQSLNISRQSISKWETGENLPSIDNLISLSGLLDISLDELITGEPYLHFPFNFGKPKNRMPVFYLLFSMILVLVIFSMVFRNFIFGFCFALAEYMIITLFYPFDFKRYFTYWTLEHQGIRYLKNSKPIYGGFVDEFVMPIRALFHLRSTDFVPYKQIKSIAIKMNLYGFEPSKILAIGPTAAYASETSQSLREPFYFEVRTIDDKIIYLDLRQYYWKGAVERKMLLTIVSFFKRKNLEFIDQQGIVELMTDNKSDIKKELYAERDKNIAI